jgi:simple sugar transport system permease protein
MLKATPLILVGLSITVAFKGKIWNIAAEGQLVAGAMAAYWISANLNLSPILLFVSNLFGAFLIGAACGWIPGYLKAKLKVDEIIVTVLFNYIIRYLFSYMLSNPWRQPDQFYHMTPKIPEAARFPIIISDSRLHAGLMVALFIVPIVYWLFKNTSLGYEIRAIGMNQTAAKFKGINVDRVIILTMMISGGIAGLAGAGELAGLHYRLRGEIWAGYGFTGIIVAMLAELSPIAVIPSAVFFGGMLNGSNRMQIATGIPTAVIYAIQAIILLLFLGAQAIVNYRIQVIRHDRESISDGDNS